MGAQHRRGPSALFLVVGLAACMSGPPPSAISEERNAAASYVLTRRAFALALAKQCRIDREAKVDLTSRAQASLEAWEQRNRAGVDAAGLYFEDYLAVVARREGYRKSVDRRAELTKQYTAAGARTAQTSVDQAGGRTRCPELLEGLARGEFDLASAEFDPVIAELVTRYSAPPK